MNNNIRGPTSALTEFLRSSGITPTTIARRAATRQQPVAGPSNLGANDEQNNAQEHTVEATPRRRTRARAAATGYASDDLDEPEGGQEDATPATKKRKLTKAAEAKLKAKEAKKKRNGDGDEDHDSEDDAYKALSKMWSGHGVKPPVGNFEDCAKCKKQFTVTKYTMAANPGPGFLCHQCAKESGSDPFKKSVAPRRKKAPADKRTIVNFEERRFPTLVSLCIGLVTKHIDDVEALGDIGALNMDSISKALSKNRGLTPQNAHLFYNATNASLTLYDATNLPSPALTTLAYLNPNLTSLRLDFCGHLDNAAMQTLTTSLSSLTSIELLGPFLVRTAAWIDFFAAHPHISTFRITQSPRFDLSCIHALVQHCGGTLTALRLKEVGKLNDEFLEEIQNISAGLEELDLSDPSASCSEDAVIALLERVGGSLHLLDLSKHNLLTDGFLEHGLALHTRVLETLVLGHLPELTDKGVGVFFEGWENQALTVLNMPRNCELGTGALTGVLQHSGQRLEVLGINGWKDVGEEALRLVGRLAPGLQRIDVGWCREMDDFVVKDWMEGDGKATTGCQKLKEVKVWGCNKITSRCPRKAGVSIYGVESHSVL